jgi:hypothetical protein
MDAITTRVVSTLPFRVTFLVSGILSFFHVLHTLAS